MNYIKKLFYLLSMLHPLSKWRGYPKVIKIGRSNNFEIADQIIALDEPEVDEEKVREILDKQDFHILTELGYRHLSEEEKQKLAHAICTQEGEGEMADKKTCPKCGSKLKFPTSDDWFLSDAADDGVTWEEYKERGTCIKCLMEDKEKK